VSCIGSFIWIYRRLYWCCDKWRWRADRALFERAASGSRYTLWICEDFIFLRLTSLIYISEVSICVTTKFRVSEFQKQLRFLCKLPRALRSCRSFHLGIVCSPVIRYTNIAIALRWKQKQLCLKTFAMLR